MATAREVNLTGTTHTVTIGDDTYRLADNVAELSYEDGAGWTVEYRDRHAMFAEQLVEAGILVPVKDDD